MNVCPLLSQFPGRNIPRSRPGNVAKFVASPTGTAGRSLSLCFMRIFGTPLVRDSDYLVQRVEWDLLKFTRKC
jgi:hypothetical protein